ncbi:alpha/beta hydrolase [Vibrio sp. Of7-15]|uniref:alpha/beta hydrolase n=1 Tax=Vibrio sp. Of7-15 TaxID=2724879 RepID=UPI001EF2CAF5|nr:alpha/beta hydrolase [Vibrio sp. Of7-15]MCG7496549.1 alpha/beta hydrolase [Vibrio sp. Of7-15]
MKMKYLTLAVASSILMLSGCNEVDSSTKPKEAELKADFNFSAQDKDKLLKERENVFGSINLTIDSVSYEVLEYGDDYHSDLSLFRLSSKSGKKIFLVAPNGEGNDSQCIAVYPDGNDYTFDCSKINEHGDSDANLLIQGSFINAPSKSVTLELSKEFEMAPYIGSTILNKQERSDGKVDITSSFAFNDFYKNYFCKRYNIVFERANYPSSLGLTTYNQLENIVLTTSDANATIVFDNFIGGSSDDDINMYTGLMINEHQYSTKVTKNGRVFSGGTDLFSAGVHRILEIKNSAVSLEENKQIGVHSWAEDDKTAKEFPFDHESHRRQATYFMKMLGDKGIDFYKFTLDSAPAEGEHWMTRKEFNKYNLVNEYNSQ